MSGKSFAEIKLRVLMLAGGTCALAESLGISSQAISQWERIPADRVGHVSRLTGMSYAEIRPDLFDVKETI